MSATNDAGKLLLTPKGEYSGSTTYEVMDAVYYITSTVKGVYVAKGTTTGTLPTDTTKWKLLIDLGDFITDASLATSSTVGLVKPDGITDEVDALGILTALGVVIKAEVNTGATAYSATWLKVGTTTLTPSTKQMYRVTENSVECLYYWNGTNYAKIPAGHTIVNASGTAMTTRSKLKFTGATITDDSTNDQTVVAITGGGADSGMVEDLVKNTVGFTGKNRAYSQTNNAVIASIESGKTYSVSWTGSATITLKKDSASGTEITSGSTSPLTFTADADYDLYFGSSADVTQIMVCDSALDGEYEDYHDSVETMFEEEIHGVNLFPNKSNTVRGITFTVDANGYTTSSNPNDSRSSTNYASYNIYFKLKAGRYYAKAVTKTASTSGYTMFILADSSINKYVTSLEDVLSGTYFDIPQDMEVGVIYKVGNGSYAFAIYKADLEITDYRPFNQQSIQHQINAQTGVLGAKNLFPQNYTTQVINGITYTVDSDKIISTSGSVATGYERSEFYLGYGTLPAGTYKFTGCPKGGSNNPWTYEVVVRKDAYSGEILGIDTGEGITFTLSSTTSVYMDIPINKNVDMSGKVFKPMLRLASDPDDTYVPFAMTNRELTGEYGSVTAVKGTLLSSRTYLFKMGKLVVISMYLSGVTLDVNSGWNTIATASEKPKSESVFFYNTTQDMSQYGDNATFGIIDTSGNIKITAPVGINNKAVIAMIIYTVE